MSKILSNLGESKNILFFNTGEFIEGTAGNGAAEMQIGIQSLEEVLMTLVGPRGLARLNTRLQRELRIQQFLESVGFHFSEDARQRQSEKILAIVTEVLTDFGGEQKQSPQSARDATGTSIDRLLTFLTQRCNHSRIQEWRQDIENQQAKKEHRTRKRIAIKTANLDFRRALKSKNSPRKKAAWKLAREFLKQPDIVAYYKKDEDLPELDVGKETILPVQAAQRHFAAQAKDKRSQAQACGQGQKKILLKQQAECLDGLEDALVGILKRMNDANIIKYIRENRFLVGNPDDPVMVAYRDYTQFMRKAVKLGLSDDPYVRSWHTNKDRQKGSKRTLSKPIPVKEQKIYGAIDSLRQQGYSWHGIHQKLMDENLISRKSWPAFQQWVTRRQLQALYP